MRRAGVPLTGEVLRGGVRLLGDVAARGALMARYVVTDVEDFLPAYDRLMEARLQIDRMP